MKIFVITGSGGFDTLVKEIDSLAAADKIAAKVTAQIGTGDYIPKNIDWFRFVSRPELEKYEAEANIIISHCGLMSLMENVRAGRTIIGVVNSDRTDAHQADIARKLEEMGHIIWCRELGDLPIMIKKAANWRPKKYTPPECSIAGGIDKFMENITDGETVRKPQDNRGQAEREAV